MSWTDFLEQNAVDHKDKVALVQQKDGQVFTYEQLWQKTCEWSQWLENQKVGFGERVAYLGENSIEHLLLFFASARLGAVFVPLNFRLAQAEIQETLALVEPRVFLTQKKFSCDFSDAPIIDDLRPPRLSGAACPKNYDVPMDAPLLMLFTSGTTGHPKGVLLHGKMLATNQRETAKAWELSQKDHTLVETPFFHTGGYNVFCLPLLALGGQVTLAPSFKPENVLETIEREKITVYFGVPTMFQVLKDHPKFETTDFSSLRFCVSGGASCPVDLIRVYQKKGVPFKQGFGLTEVGPNCFLLEAKDAIRKAGSIGKPMPHSDVLVLTSEGHPAKANESGELLIKGDHVCAGHFKREEQFQNELFDGYFKTGDLVQFDEQGFFYVVGRLKDMYISGGENVYPGEVERKCLELEGVCEAVVVSVPDKKWGEVGFAWLQGDKNFTDALELKGKLGPLLSGYKRPHYLKWVDDFPLLPNGKIDRVACQKMACALITDKG